MNSFSQKGNKVNYSEKNISNSMDEVNKKLEEIIDSKISSEINSNMKIDLFNFKINDNNTTNHIYSEQKGKDNNNEYNFQKMRLNFEKIMNSDILADSYDILPSNEQFVNMRNINENCLFSVPYTKNFEDNILLKDESIFFVFDDNYKNKFITREDIQNIKNNKNELNFGEDPFEVYQQISEEKIPPIDTSSDFNNCLNSFSIFKTKDPYFIKINTENLNENDLNNLNNYNSFYNNEQEMKYNDDCNTRENSRNSKIKEMAETMAKDENNYSLNNKIFFYNEDEEEELEGEEIERGINRKDNNLINRKRKNPRNDK